LKTFNVTDFSLTAMDINPWIILSSAKLIVSKIHDHPELETFEQNDSLGKKIIETA